MRIHLTIVAATLVACSGSGSDTTADRPDSGQAIAETGVPDDTSADAAGDADVSLDQLCTSLIDATCGEEAKTCCTTTGISFARAGCRDLWTSVCQSQVDAVKAGKARYVPSALGACVSAWRDAWTSAA